MNSLPAPPVDEISHLQRAAKGGLVALLALAGLWTLHRYIDALIWASILAIAVWPFYRRTRDRWPPGWHNVVLPACFTAAIALVVVIPLILVGIEAAKEVGTILDAINTARAEGIPPPAWLARLPILSTEASSWWRQHLASPESAQALLEQARHSSLASQSRAFGAMAVHRVVLFGFTLLTLFFLLRDGERLAAQLQRAGQRAFGPSGERIGRQMIASVHGTVDGLVLVGLGEGLILGVGYVIAGVPHPTLFGLLTAVAAMVPFGAPLAFGIAALTLLVQAEIGWAIGIAALGMVVTFVADHFIRPALIGKTTRLPFLWVLLGILGGVETWGLVGLFLGPAIMAALILLWREFTA
ncbi:AI-2E family transporter [Rhodopila sp.]|uniref:AI-2E family transporter n=1 Tax=Rhodopila sp. TaxID=2480087 RepID=UPI002CFA58BA|nr:AI-2E family transporter [Rhodopila sp.]HVZ09269.1 AI-2E family transporter [Rhodopila sp.]